MSKVLEFDRGGNNSDGQLIYAVAQISIEIKLILEDSLSRCMDMGEKFQILNSIIPGMCFRYQG
jgi:hypothetical protein